MMPDHTRKDEANFGGKIFLPSSALGALVKLNIQYPMLFSLTNESEEITTHSGVLEFVAEEGRAYLPQWMMNVTKAQPGSLLKISSCDLPLGSFVKIEPQSVDFLDISDPKAVLENTLRKFSTLTINDIIEISYNDKVYAIRVLEAKPESENNSICVVETDLQTDFAPPVGYVEPEPITRPSSSSVTGSGISRGSTPAVSGTMAQAIKYRELAKSTSTVKNQFTGTGNKLSGRKVKLAPSTPETEDDDEPLTDLEGPPVPLVLPYGKLFFGFPLVPAKHEGEEEEKETFNPFAGQGQSLRKSKKRKDHNKDKKKKKTRSPKQEIIEID